MAFGDSGLSETSAAFVASELSETSAAFGDSELSETSAAFGDSGLSELSETSAVLEAFGISAVLEMVLLIMEIQVPWVSFCSSPDILFHFQSSVAFDFFAADI